jgi:hypothetical protein
LALKGCLLILAGVGGYGIWGSSDPPLTRFARQPSLFLANEGRLSVQGVDGTLYIRDSGGHVVATIQGLISSTHATTMTLPQGVYELDMRCAENRRASWDPPDPGPPMIRPSLRGKGAPPLSAGGKSVENAVVYTSDGVALQILRGDDNESHPISLANCVWGTPGWMSNGYTGPDPSH